MANEFTYQVLKDTTEHAVIKLTGKWDSASQEDNPHRISANSLYGALNTDNGLLSVSGSALPYYGLTIHRIWYDTYNGAGGDLELYWNANPTVTLMLLSGNSEYDGAGNWVTISNAAYGAPGVSECNGDIGIKTRGYSANTSYTIVLELRKQNEYYQRGQLNDPAAFNYGVYSITPHTS
jgi:hypothetical protein